MLDFYGGTIKCVYVSKLDQYPEAELASLLGRQRALERIMVNDLEILPELASSIEQGFLRNVREVEIMVFFEEDEEITSALDHLQCLRTLMQVPGALQTLEVMCIYLDERICFPTI